MFDLLFHLILRSLNPKALHHTQGKKLTVATPVKPPEQQKSKAAEKDFLTDCRILYEVTCVYIYLSIYLSIYLYTCRYICI